MIVKLGTNEMQMFESWQDTTKIYSLLKIIEYFHTIQYFSHALQIKKKTISFVKNNTK